MAPTEVTLQTNGQPRDLLLGVTRLANGYLVNFADITRLKEVERLKSDIVANVSHELRSPLASIKGYTELLMEDMDRDDPALRRRFLAVINEETDRLSVFIDEMLNLARLEAGHITLDLTPMPMGSLVIDAARSLKLQADAADVALHIHVPADMPAVLVDMNWMYSALKNLIGNAIKFSPRGAAVEVIASSSDMSAVIEVIDQGPGIAPQDLPNLFTKFYRGSTARQLGVSGSGLGLVLAKQAIESHHGTIVAENGESCGARFIVTLPIAGAADRQAG